MNPKTSELAGRRVLVTGATGFIGGRLVEHLVERCGAQVRALVRSFARAPRIARFPVEMVPGDLGDAGAIASAAAGCAVIFHCGVGLEGSEAQQRAITLDGTKHVLNAARRAGGARVVHVSTINVYGDPTDGDLDETRPRRYAGDVYSDSKLDAEQAVLAAAARGDVPATVLQPTIVYGPFGPAWTVRILSDLRSGQVILVNGGDGLCNAVYVDDVVQALVRAACTPDAVGQAFLVSGSEPITWREFYAGHERILGVDATVSMTAAAAAGHFRDLVRRKRLLRESVDIVRQEVHLRRRIRGTAEVAAALAFARRVVPGPLRRSLKRTLIGTAGANTAAAPASSVDRPIVPLAPAAIRMAAAKTRVRIDKARAVLGYEPAFDFPSGMARVEAWARWAGLAGREAARA